MLKLDHLFCVVCALLCEVQDYKGLKQIMKENPMLGGQKVRVTPGALSMRLASLTTDYGHVKCSPLSV